MIYKCNKSGDALSFSSSLEIGAKSHIKIFCVCEPCNKGSYHHRYLQRCKTALDKHSDKILDFIFTVGPNCKIYS